MKTENQAAKNGGMALQLELRNVCYKAGRTKSGNHRFELDNISFCVEEGFITGLVGVNGAGKTTIFNMLMNIRHTDEGEILLNGNDIKTAYRDRMKIGFISEDQRFINERTLLENARLRGIFYDDFSEDKFKLTMKEINMSHSRGFGNCSRGEKIKFQLAFALSCDAEILLIDEATAGMDTVFRKDFFKILHTFMENERHSILISTHNEEEVKRHMDYVVYLENGKARYICQQEEGKSIGIEKSLDINKSIGIDKVIDNEKSIDTDKNIDNKKVLSQNSQLQKIKLFDEQLAEMYSGDIMLQKLAYIFMLVLGMSGFFFSCEFPDTIGILVGFMWLVFIGIQIYLGRFIHIKSSENTKIYDILKWLPVDADCFIQSRVRYLNKMMIKLGIIALILSHIIPACTGEWNIYCVLVPVVEMLSLWLIAYHYIKS